MREMIGKYIKKIMLLCKEREMVPIPQPINTVELLRDKIALITGGSGGIGSEIAKAFVKSGCKVILIGTNEERLKCAAEKCGGGYQVSRF